MKGRSRDLTGASSSSSSWSEAAAAEYGLYRYSSSSRRSILPSDPTSGLESRWHPPCPPGLNAAVSRPLAAPDDGSHLIRGDDGVWWMSVSLSFPPGDKPRAAEHR